MVLHHDHDNVTIVLITRKGLLNSGFSQEIYILEENLQKGYACVKWT